MIALLLAAAWLSAGPVPTPTLAPVTYGTNPAPTSKSLCIAGTTYTTSQDDEFYLDANLDAVQASGGSIDLVGNASHMWGTKVWYGGQPYVPGVHWEFVTDPSLTSWWNGPFFKAPDGSLVIEALPIPVAHAADAQFNPNGAPHPYGYVSGWLNGHPLTYGYVEINSRAEHMAGMWPGDVWLLAHNGSDGAGHGYTELDMREIFGSLTQVGRQYQSNQTFISNATGTNNQQTRAALSPDTSQSYHTFGLLWTASSFTFYIDHVLTGGPYPNVTNAGIGAIQATGPMSPLINLQVFGPGAWSPQADAVTPGFLFLKWYRWYQTTGTACSTSDL